MLYRKFLAQLKKLNIPIEVYFRYVDDEDICCYTIKAGVRYNPLSDQLTYDQDLVEHDRLLDGDERTFRILQQIANTLENNIQLEFEVPSGNNGKMPLLDLKVWSDNNQIFWEFYKKPMASL